MYEALTIPSVVPALGRDVSIDYRTHSRDLLAQKLELFVPFTVPRSNLAFLSKRVNQMNDASPKRLFYTLAMPLAILMLVFWAIMTFAFSGPGWVHLFLSLGVFLLIWRITAGGTESAWQRYVSHRDTRTGKPRGS
jgi:hypothetical protein